MPDISGHLSSIEIAAIQQWMKDRHGGTPFPCPVSRHTDWHINEYVYQNIVFPLQSQSTSLISPLSWPVVQVVCGGCGYTIYFNAGLIGLYPSLPAAPTPPAE